jgi:hypothetical protein
MLFSDLKRSYKTNIYERKDLKALDVISL